MAEEIREDIGGVAAEEEEGEAESFEVAGDRAESAEHEAELAGVGAKKTAGEAEGDGEGDGGARGEISCMKEGPVVGDSLVAKHPVDDGARRGGGGGARPEEADAGRVDCAGCGAGCDDCGCHLGSKNGGEWAGQA